MDEDALLTLSHKEYKDGNYNKALEYCGLVHEKNPSRTEALLLLGAIYYQVWFKPSHLNVSNQRCIKNFIDYLPLVFFGKYERPVSAFCFSAS